MTQKSHLVLLMLEGQEVWQKEHKLWCKTDLVSDWVYFISLTLYP